MAATEKATTGKTRPGRRRAGSPAGAPAPRAGRLWRQDPDARRAMILEAAEAEIVGKGVDGLRTGPLAKRAGVAEGTVFSLFGSKNAVIVEVGRRWAQGMVEAAFEPLMRGPIDTPDIEAFVTSIFAYAARTTPLMRAFFWTGNKETAETVDVVIRDQIVEAIDEAITRDGSPGRRFDDSRVAAAIQFGMVENALRDCFVRGDGKHRDAYSREVSASLRAMLGLSDAR